MRERGFWKQPTCRLFFSPKSRRNCQEDYIFINCSLISNVNVECNFTLYEKRKNDGHDNLFYQAKSKNRIAIGTFVFSVASRNWMVVD